jgi:hypothetical protein
LTCVWRALTSCFSLLAWVSACTALVCIHKRKTVTTW